VAGAPSDEVRRQLRASAREQTVALRELGPLLDRMGDHRDERPAEGAPELLLGQLHRRRFLQVGAVSILSAAVLAACSKPSRAAGGGRPTTTTTDAAGNAADITILRTASSIEHFVVALYVTAAGSGVVTTADLADTAKYFADQHSEHAAAFEAATTRAGGDPFTQANPVLAGELAARIQGLRTERDVVQLAYEVERAMVATFTDAAGTFADGTLDATVMSVGAVEARHVAVLSMILAGRVPGIPVLPPGPGPEAFPPAGFETGAGAIVPGTGV